MKILILILVMVINLSGCVGFTYSRNGDVAVSEDFAPVEFEYQKKPPDSNPDKVNLDGSETFRVYEETKWCGLTIWAIIPIPLWLPICNNYTEVTYKDKKPIKAETQGQKTFYGLCGPLAPLLTMHGRDYCHWRNFGH